MLGISKKKHYEKKELKKKQEDLLRRADEMRKLTLAPNTGWIEYIRILNEYIQACMKRKALTSLDIATEKEIYDLKLIDHEVYFLTNFVMKIPNKIFANEKEILKEIQKREKLDNNDSTEDT